ncbi:hypothetical protein [Actinocorallia aurantiaca]|uniref:hypothetical protein n=1 Tax=Actinocorallia aurantiaca TaxID=46204 RepID=UPI0031D63A24
MFNKPTRWTHAVTVLGFPGLRFHDLRHTGNTFAAATGATTKDLMRRMGHDNERAALIYQHATTRADRAIALGIDALVNSHRKDEDDDGAAGALAPVG